MNADPAEYVTRGAAEVCGVVTRKTLPGCSSLHRAVSSTNLEQLDRNVECVPDLDRRPRLAGVALQGRQLRSACICLSRERERRAKQS